MIKIHVGDVFTEKIKYSQKDVDAFAEVTGDKNPIHIDPEYASKTIFGRPIVHGFFASAVFSKVFGTQWPGEGTIYMSQEMAFRAPVFVDTEYEAKFEAIEINEEKHRGVIKTSLVDVATGKEVISGQAKLQHNAKF